MVNCPLNVGVDDPLLGLPSTTEVKELGNGIVAAAPWAKSV
jgi:hypothetical protein